MDDPLCSTEDNDDCLSKIPFHQGKDELEKKYVYESVIGNGAYGYVMCGYRKIDHVSVAIKVIPSQKVGEWYETKTLQRTIPLEVLLLSLAREIDGVVAIVEYYEDPQRMEWYIVMERHIRTMDLFLYIKKSEYLEEDIACCILWQLLVIIRECHRRGVVHRDIKEENILIDPSTRRVWIIDFGSGCLMRDDCHETYDGTLAYSPPEWLRNKRYRGCQLESWTLGIVLYSMLCGCVPFEDEEQILSGVVRFPRKLSKSCVDLIMSCLQSDPELRIQPLKMMTHPWVLDNRCLPDSGRSSFDEVFNETPIRRKCSCSCGENTTCQRHQDVEENLAAIETVAYDENCIKDIDPEWQFKVIVRSFSLDIERKEDLILLTNFHEIMKSNMHKSMTNFDELNEHHYTIKKNSSFTRTQDNGYNEDIDDNFNYEEESLIVSNEEFY